CGTCDCTRNRDLGEGRMQVTSRPERGLRAKRNLSSHLLGGTALAAGAVMGLGVFLSTTSPVLADCGIGTTFLGCNSTVPNPWPNAINWNPTDGADWEAFIGQDGSAAQILVNGVPITINSDANSNGTFTLTEISSIKTTGGANHHGVVINSN